MTIKKFLAAAAILIVPVALQAEDFAIRMTGANSSQFKSGRVAVLSYSINFITAQRATASSDVMVKSKVSTTLGGVDEATMRRLVNEAHADLVAQLKAAGISVTTDVEIRQLIADSKAPLLPGNVDRGGGTGGITIGTSVKKEFVAFGADHAPLTSIYQTGGKVGGLAAFGKIGGGTKLNKPASALNATVISPSLTIDFADSEAKTGRSITGMKRSSATTEAQFAIRATSPVNMEIPHPLGIGWPGMMTMMKDVTSATPFALTAGVSSATSTAGTYSDPGMAAGGNVVTVNLPIWTGLVQSAYRSYNAAIVEQIVKAKKK